MKKLIIQIVLGIAVVVLGYLCVDSIMKPLEFEKEKNRHEERVIQRLKDIRTAQEAYKGLHGIYTASFDTLIHFVKYDSMKVVRAIGDLTDDQLEAGMTELEAIKKGFIIRDTIRKAAIDSLFGKDYPIDDLRYVPFTNRKHEFKMMTNTIYTDSGYEISIFEAKAPNTVIFEDMMEKYKTFIEEENWKKKSFNKYPGLKVGSIKEANNNVGNWE